MHERFVYILNVMFYSIDHAKDENENLLEG